MALILFILAVEETEATLEDSRQTVREMTLTFCVVELETEAKVTLKFLDTLSVRWR